MRRIDYDPCVHEGPCLPDELVAAILEGNATAREREQAAAHAAECAPCRELLACAARVRARDEPVTLAGHPRTGDCREESCEEIETHQIGRFEILHPIGAGGMGIVFAARDTDLHRTVAIKLLRFIARETTDGARARMLSEARTMARVEHPNVATVHEVGVHDGRVFIVMDWVRGGDLRAWTQLKPRHWEEIVDAWLGAAAGLAAIHDRGLVHRDFKPHNVLIDEQARALVTDFGLVDVAQHTDPDEDDHASPGDATRTRALLGTPRYMAPEQLACEAVGPAADQFAFCVSLWEALHGAHPFGEGAREAHEWLARKHAGAPSRRADSKVPVAVDAVLRRGLALDPRGRYPDMPALSGALRLARDAHRRRKRVIVASVGAMAVLAAGLAIGASAGASAELAAQGRERARREGACEQSAALVGLDWNDEARTRARAGLLASSTPHAVQTADKVTPWLDEYAAQWRSARVEVCRRADVHEIWDASLAARAVSCLEERRLELGALVTELQHADDATVTLAVSAVAALRPVDPCLDATLLARRPEVPGEHQDEIAAIGADLAKARALEVTGAYERALALARESSRAADAIGWAPLRARTRVHVGTLLEYTGAYEDAEAVLESAYFEASASGAIEHALVAAHSLVLVVHQRGRPEDALRWARQAEVLRAAMPDPGRLHEATWLINVALVRLSIGDYEDAAAFNERALGIFEATLGPDHPDVALSLGNLADVRSAMGEYAASAELHERSLKMRERTLGPDHPAVASNLNNLAVVHFQMGEHDRAIELYARARDIFERAMGPDHPHVAASIGNIGNVHRATGAYEEAARHYERAHDIFVEAFGAEHPSVAMTLGNLAGVRYEAGAYDESAALYERALRILETTLGPEHPDVAKSLHNLGGVRTILGEHEEARRLHERALRIRETTLGPDHPDVAYSLVALARIDLAEGRRTDAATRLQRALEIREGKSVAPDVVAETRSLLARAHTPAR
jgi:tetratricopeptide (TPR) repeat protein